MATLGNKHEPARMTGRLQACFCVMTQHSDVLHVVLLKRVCCIGSGTAATVQC